MVSDMLFSFFAAHNSPDCLLFGFVIFLPPRFSPRHAGTRQWILLSDGSAYLRLL